MIFNFGYLVLVLALILAVSGMAAGFYGGYKRNTKLAVVSINAVYAVGALVILAAVILWYGLLTDKFQVLYVWNHSERNLPNFYKFSALWGGQAGSLLFWTFILSIYSILVVSVNRRRHWQIIPYVSAVLLSTSIFFLTLSVFAANPFAMADFVPTDGRGLNPLLQNYWMVIHPVMLYLGYVGMAIPFAFAVAALLSKRLQSGWVRTVRRWTLIPWLFLSIGILMGSQWAYLELGWGGYWAWDPVENASFLPWLTATAFLHSIVIQEQRGILKIWNMVLIWLTYFLVILGTFTTRSGVLESVHSFARSNIGPFFLVFMGLVLFGFLWLLFDRMPLLRDEQPIESYTSREAAFMANNWLFTGIAFATLWGTFFPMFSEILTGERISVAAPFFNKVNGPLFLLLFILMGVAPLLGWRRTSVEAMKRQFTWPTVIGLLVAAAVAVFTRTVYPSIGLGVCAFATTTIVQEYVRGIRARRTATGENTVVAMSNLWRRNGRRYGGYMVHLGMVLIAVAVIGNQFFQQTTNVTLGEGETVNIGPYELQYVSLTSDRQSNAVQIGAEIQVYRKGNTEPIAVMNPRRNIYDKTPEQPTSEVGLRMSFVEDIYVVLNGWENDGATATFSIFLNPLMIWMWIGGIVLAIGTLIAAWPHPAQRRSPVVSSVAYAVGSGD